MKAFLKILISIILALAIVIAVRSVILSTWLSKETVAPPPDIKRTVIEQAPVVNAKDREKMKAIVISKTEIPKAGTAGTYIADMNIRDLIGVLGGNDILAAREASDRIADLGSMAVPDLIKALPSASDRLKGQIAFILGRINSTEAVLVLLDTLQDPNPYVRRNSAEALGKIADNAAEMSLVKALTDNDPGVRQYAAWSLGQIGSTEAVIPLVEKVRTEADYSAKTAMVNALGKIKDSNATVELMAQLNIQEDSLYKDEVVIALGNIGDAAALPALDKYLDEIKQYKPIESTLIFQQNETIKNIEEAIEKIKSNNGRI